MVHAHDRFGPDYFLFHIAKVWQEAGIEVFVVQGARHRPSADLVVLHTDVTKVDFEYLATARSYPRTINGRVADISKRVISENVISGPQTFDGPVIVKSDRNCGDRREAQIAQDVGDRDGYVSPLAEYSIYPTAGEVPASVWHDRSLVVEKFLPERKDEFYCLRTWMFFGDKEANTISYSHQPIIKSHNIVKRDVIGSVPESIRRIREELAFDYGRFDYAVADGSPVLYDANRTPTLGGSPNPQLMSRFRLFAEGLRSFLPAAM
jgi:hypothetical protein